MSEQRDIETANDPDPEDHLPDPLTERAPLNQDPDAGELPSDADVQAERQP